MYCIIWLLLFFGNILLTDQQGPSIEDGVKKIMTNLKPTFDKNHSNAKKELLDWLLTGCSGSNCSEAYNETEAEFPGYDGWYNNIGRPDLGAIDTPLLRRWPAAYEDGVYKPSGRKRPNPLDLSEKLLKAPLLSFSRTGKNALLVFFGQQVVEEILDAQRPACPPEYFNIDIPENHTFRELPGHTELPVLRTRYDATTGFSPNNPRQQLNEITPYLDGGLIYGTSRAWSDTLRTYSNGTIHPHGLLARSPDGLFPEINTVRLPMANPPPPAHHPKYVKRHSLENVNRFFKLGNPRGNENPFLLTFGIVWFRWHNHLAEHIHNKNPLWSGEKVFNEARKWVIATQQHIVTNVWLPEWLGAELGNYTSYDPSINPQIDQFFQAAAFRFGHTLVVPGVRMRDYGRKGCKLDEFGTLVRTCNHFWRPQDAILTKRNNSNEIADIDRLLMGMAGELCAEEDHKIVEDLRGNVFGPLEFSRRDLMALNIQRGRDHGLPDFNTARKAYNLEKVTSKTHFRKVNDTILDTLLEMHNNSFDDIDIWVGGILETEDGPGELFRTIITDQFERIRNGDRFWYKNKNNGLFTDKEIERLENLTFYDILMSITKMDHNDIPKNPFKVFTSESEVHENCINSTIIKGECTTMECYHTMKMVETEVENCTDPGTYDYFENSDISFILTFLSLTTFICGLATLIMFTLRSKRKQQVKLSSKLRQLSIKDKKTEVTHSANEWISRKSPKQPVIVILDNRKKQIQVNNQLGHLTRALDFAHSSNLKIFVSADNHYVMLKVSHNYDLVLKFESDYMRELFLNSLKVFQEEANVQRENVKDITMAAILKQAVTRKDRQAKLEKFFRVVFSQTSVVCQLNWVASKTRLCLNYFVFGIHSQKVVWTYFRNHEKLAFHIAHSEDEILMIDSKVAREVIYTELTITEFAEALSMRPDSEFVDKIFNFVDKDKNGFISFREFVDMLVVFMKGNAEDKVKLMFDMYDINGNGKLKREEFGYMLRSFMETGNVTPEEGEIKTIIDMMMHHAGLADKEEITLADFQRLLGDFNDKLSYATLEFNVGEKKLHAANTTVRSSYIGEAQKLAESIYADPNELKSRIEGKRIIDNRKSFIDDNVKITKAPAKSTDQWYPLMKYIANNQLQIFWMFLYTAVLIAIFVERAYYYSVEREHSGLRRIAGYGVTVTRGAASAIMFTYSTMLLTMCHNTITFLRESILASYIPFDSAIEMHKYIAYWALGFTIMHIVGHAFNFYHIATQTSDDLTCLFRNYFHATHEIPKFHYWCWQTMTGLTGVLLTIVGAIIYICSLSVVRSRLHKWFRIAHCLYPIFYILMILHGTGRLIQEPFLHYFLLGPVILFTLDRALTATRKNIIIPILKADILPSGVTCIEFPKPSNFQYKSGQWVRIACPALQTNEYHPFTLSSAPNENNLTVHIRAVGPWTSNIRYKLDPTLNGGDNMPTIHLDGPYGDAHQNWYKYDVAVMVAGGIGVTPFASILKDIVHKSNHGMNLGCKKVYFLWITRTQQQFEWMVDILRDVENTDANNVVSAHIFITQFYHKFDLRTILLYICELHFQRVSNRSLFTGLMAVTHFGRPNLSQFFKAIQQLHINDPKVGVFSCGPVSLNQAVETACKSINEQGDSQNLFQHYSQAI